MPWNKSNPPRISRIGSSIDGVIDAYTPIAYGSSQNKYTPGTRGTISGNKLILGSSGTSPTIGRYQGIEGRLTWSMVWVGTPTALVARGALFSKGAAFGAAMGFATSSSLFLYPTGVNTDYYAEFPNIFATNTRVVIALTVDNGVVTVYKDGISLGTMARGGGSGNTATTSTSEIAICGNDGAATLVDMQANIEFFGLFNRVLTASEVKALSKDPYQVYAKDYRQSYLAFNSAGGILAETNNNDRLSSSGTSINPQHGLALLDFRNNNNETSITITNPAILSTSKSDAYFIGYDSTVDHSASDHRYAPLFIKLSCESLNGAMIIHARSRYKMSGKFLIKYIWSN